jgi:hypothetical protein
MKTYDNNAQYTAMVHSMIKHKVQAILWDLLVWLDGDGEIQSVRDILSYIRLFTDFGDNSQGRLFFESMRRQKTLRLVLPEIASRLVSRGKATGSTWLEDLGLYIQELHKIEPHPGVGAVRDHSDDV